MRTRRVASLVSVVAVGVVGCGGGDSGPSTKEFTTQLDALCATFDNGIGDIDSEDANFIDDRVDLLEDLRDGAAALETPKDLQTPKAAFTALLDDIIDALEDVDEAVDDGDLDQLRDSGEEVIELEGDTGASATALGAAECDLDLDLDTLEEFVDGREEEEEQTLSEDELSEQLLDICLSMRDELDDVDSPESETDFAGMVELAEESLPILEEADAELRALEPPASQAGEFDDLVELSRTQIGLIEDLGEAAADEDTEAVAEILVDLEELSEDAADLREELGFEECEPDAG